MQNLFRESIYYSYEDEIRQPFYLERELLHHLIQQFGSFLTKDLATDEDRYFQTLLLEFGAKEKPLLSQREQEVLQEMSTGASNKEIAERLYISTATVKTHLINLYGKLHVNNRVAAIEAAKKTWDVETLSNGNQTFNSLRYFCSIEKVSAISFLSGGWQSTKSQEKPTTE